MGGDYFCPLGNICCHLRPTLRRIFSCSVILSEGPSSSGEQFCFSFCAININGFLKYEEALQKNCTRTNFYRKDFLFSTLKKRGEFLKINYFNSYKWPLWNGKIKKIKKRNPNLTSLFQSSTSIEKFWFQIFQHLPVFVGLYHIHILLDMVCQEASE